MSKVAKGLFAAVAVMVLVVTMGAGRNAADNGADVAQEKAVRTAGVDVAIGSFECRGEATGAVTTNLTWQGTSGVVTASSGFSIELVTTVIPVEATATCATIVDGAVALAEELECSVSLVRFVGVTRDFTMVCHGITDDTNDDVGKMTRYVAENARTE